jgi:hypothetical protein
MPNALSRRASGTAHGFSRVISPSRRYCTSHTTSCAAYLPTKSNESMPSVPKRSRTGVCSAEKQCWCRWRVALKRSAVLTRPSRLTRACSVGENTIGDTLLRASGCSAVSNVSLAEHFLCQYRTEPDTLMTVIDAWIEPDTMVISDCWAA